MPEEPSAAPVEAPLLPRNELDHQLAAYSLADLSGQDDLGLVTLYNAALVCCSHDSLHGGVANASL
jgi:hypothetical protein